MSAKDSDRQQTCSLRCLQALLALSFFGPFAPATCIAAQPGAHTGPRIWYKKPAAQWRQAIPIGNGRIGAMVFGGANSIAPNGDSQDEALNAPIADGFHTRAQDEHLQLNEDTLWQGNRADRLNPRAAAAFPEIRRLLFAGKVAEAEALASSDMIAIPPALPSYSTLGDLYLRSPGRERAQDYRRQLDLATGIVRITYTIDGVHFEREIFASAVDHVIVVHLSADRPGRISFSVNFDRPADFTTSAFAPDSLLLEPGADHPDSDHQGAIRFRGQVKLLHSGGSMRAEDSQLTLANATSATLLIAAATDFRGGPFPGGDPAVATATVLAAASQKSYGTLRLAAASDNRSFFDRVQLQLGPAVDPFADVPTDERLRLASSGAKDPNLAVLYFQYGRYLLIASSRPGGLPANLQGLWAAGIENPWGSKYTLNINAEMNYWLAEVGNLSELHQPLFDLLDMVRTPGTGTGVDVAQRYYGAPGFVVHHNTDIWGDAVPIDGYRWGMWPMGGAWLALDEYDHFAYTGDVAFLRDRSYPVLRQCVQFFLHYLTPDAEGHLVTGPSISPENSYRLPDGSEHSLAMGPVMDIEIARALFASFIQASALLNADTDLRAQVETALPKLPPFKIGRFGQLQEWQQDYTEAEPGHRHISHLWALFPGDQISPRATPELARAAQTTLERRLAAGGGQTGWSRAWVMNDWARLGRGDEAYESLQVLLRQSTYPNLLDDCPPGPVFQIDGNLGGAAGIANMLLQSVDGEIDLLPALPSAWPDGQFRGLHARGGAIVDLTWHASKATSTAVHATIDGPLSVRPPKGQRIQSVKSIHHGVAPSLRTSNDGSVSFIAHRGDTYFLTIK